MNRVVVIIEQEHEGAQFRHESSAQFPDGDFDRGCVLDVFRDALKGAGYICDELDVVDLAEPGK